MKRAWISSAALFTALSCTAAADEAPRLRLDFAATYSDLSHDRDDWREGSAGLSYDFGDGWRLGGAIEAASRFGQFDAYLEARADHEVASGVWVYGLTGGTPDADFRPRVAFGAGGSARLFQQRGFLAAGVATLDLRYGDYTAGDVETVNPGFELYLIDGRATLTARHINIWDETGRHREGFFVRGDAQPTDTLTVFAGYADAPDTSEGVTVDVRGWFGGVAVDVDERSTVRAVIGQDLRDTGYDRTTFTLALTLKR